MEIKEEALKRYFSGAAASITTRNIDVKFIPSGRDLGYTSQVTSPKGEILSTIYLGIHAPFLEKLTTKEDRMFFIKGVFTHEVCHQLFTNFKYEQKVAKKIPETEQRIFHSIVNLVEDPAIEFFCPTKIGGSFHKALRFSIRKVHELSNGIGDEASAFIQYQNALVFFGDMGKVKGKFTFPKAEEMFRKTAHLFNVAVETPDSKKRVDIAKEIFEMSRPLWEKELEDIKNMDIDKTLVNCSSDAEVDLSDMSEEDISDLEKTTPERKDAKTSEKHSETSSGSEGDKEEESSTSGKSRKSSDSSDEAENSKSSMSDETEKRSESSFNDEEDAAEKEAFEKELKRLEKAIEKESADPEEEDLSVEWGSRTPFYDPKSVRNKNHIMSKELPVEISDYNRMKKEFSWEIKQAIKSLQKITKEEREELCPSDSGRYNVLRGAIGCTNKIFDKKTCPDAKKSTGVFVLIDESGSMGCERRYEAARKTAIIMAEACAAEKIPCKIVGFSADEGDAQAVHRHYTSWSNSLKERASLANIKPYWENFDGFSIRYAVKLLEKTNFQNKILMVISDGEPACHSIPMPNGLLDVEQAIKEARSKQIKVFGIALGSGVNTSVMHKWYGINFASAINPDTLSTTFLRSFEKLLK